MPTAGRLAAAVFFGLFSWYLAGISIAYFPERNAPSYLIPLSAVLGILIGWRVCGSRAGKGYKDSVATGLTTAFVLTFWILYIMGFLKMMQAAMRHSYDGAIDALMGSFSQAFEIGALFFNVHMIGTVIIGSIVCAMCVEYFAKRYP